MPNGYVGKTNNHVGKFIRPRASHLKTQVPARAKSFEQLAYEMCHTFGTPEGEAARHALLERMGIEPAT